MHTLRALYEPKMEHKANGSTKTRLSQRSNTSSCLDSEPTTTQTITSIFFMCDAMHVTTDIG
jgi:hypothetical protein